MASDASSWLTITSGSSGTGQTSLTFSVAQNFGGKRTGKIIIQPTAGGQRVVTVEQQSASVTGSSGFGTQATSGNAKTASRVSALTASNPSSGEIAAEFNRAAQEHQIPANILGAVAHVGSAWQQFDASGNPFVGTDGRIGIMQIDTQNPIVPMDSARVGADWRYNIEIGCQILRAAWGNRVGNSLSPYDDENDADPAILENWFHPVAWQRGTGAVAYAFVGSVWNALKSPPTPVSTYFGAASDIGDPRKLAGFPTTIGSVVPQPAISNVAMATPPSLVASGKFSLMILRLSDQRIHRWNWDSTDSGIISPVDVTESIRTEPPIINYETWASYLDDFTDGAGADIDGDGVPNLIECALGGDPIDANSSPSPSVSLKGTNFEMTAKITKYVTGLEFAVESSVDCLNWTPTYVTPSLSSEDSVSQTVKWVVPASGTELFIRLRITNSK